MTKRWIGLFPCASIIFALATSCGSSDGRAGGSAGSAGNAGTAVGGNAGANHGAGTSGVPEPSGGGDSGGSAGADVIVSGGSSGAESAGAGADNAGADNAGADNAGGSAGAGGSPEVPEDPSASPAAIPGLAFWMDGRAPSYSDLDENYLTPKDSGRIRSIAEAAPLTGHWYAQTSPERPTRARGAVFFKPIESRTGYNLKSDTATIHTDDSTLAISFRPLNGAGGPAQGGISGQIGNTEQALGILFIGNGLALSFNHTTVALKRRLPRGGHVSMIVRFKPTGVDVQYDIDGLRASETIAATIDRETVSRFQLGFDPNNKATIYGFVSQLVGVDRAVTDDEESKLMDWLSTRPIPDAFPVTAPLVAILGDSIANGDQVEGWETWPFLMLAGLSDVTPDVRLLKAATNGSGIPKVKNSDYSDVVLPWYSSSRAKNILLVASGSNDLAGGNNVSDLLERYWGLFDSARATGWKTVACTVLPRSDSGLAAGLAGFDADRTTFNASIVAHWAEHADALADVAAVEGMGAFHDSDNTTNYGTDKIHPTAAGHALMAPVYQAAVASLLQ